MWTLRVMIPLDLQAACGGRTKAVESLKTTSHSEAELAATSRRAELLQEIEQKRRESNPQRIDKITPELSNALAQRGASRVLINDDRLRDDPDAAGVLLDILRPFGATGLTIGPLPPAPVRASIGGVLEGLSADEAAELAIVNRGADLHSASLMSKRQRSAVLPVVQAEALALGLVFDPETPGAPAALLESLKAYRKAIQDVSQRDSGAVIETPEAPSLRDVPKATPVFLRDVSPQWKKSKVRKLATEKSAAMALGLNEVATGNPPIATLTRSRGADMRAFLLAGGVTAKTARDRFDDIKGFLNFATHQLELLPRRTWSGEQVAALFARPLHTAYNVPTRWDSGTDAAYWLPRLGICTGARVSELCQMQIADIEIIDGIPILRITDAGEDQRVKTSAGKRMVPIHAELIRLGFLDHVQALRKAGAARLFPALTLHKTKPGTYFFSGWFAEGRDLPNKSKLPDFHSLRHTVCSKLASADMQAMQIACNPHERSLSGEILAARIP